MMRVAVYLRVSTDDKGQNVDTQRLPLQDFCAAQGWPDVKEYADEASAADMRGRSAWRQLLKDASQRKVDLLLVWRLDRAFRSVLDAAETLEKLRAWGVAIRSYSEPWLDTTTPHGEALYHITVAWAQHERSILRERVKAGMERAKREGKHVGRPRITDNAVVMEKWQRIKADVIAGRLSRIKAAKKLGIGEATVRRLLMLEDAC